MTTETTNQEPTASRRAALRQRLSEEAEALATEAIECLFDQTFEAVFDPAAVAELLGRLLDSETLVPTVLRRLREEVERETTRWKEIPDTLGARIPAPLADKARALAGNPDLFRGDWLGKLASNEVLEQVMGATLYEVLREFNASVNPFFSIWGLPSLLKKAGPLGKLGFFGINLKSGSRFLEGLREEFERQLEPHMKTFLQKASKMALLRAVAHTQSEENLQAFARLRLQLLDKLSQRKLSDLERDLTPAIRDRIETESQEAFEAIRQSLRSMDLQGWSIEWMQRHGSKTLRQLLRETGLEPAQIEGPLAAVCTPAVRAVLASDSVVNRLEAVFRTL